MRCQKSLLKIIEERIDLKKVDPEEFSNEMKDYIELSTTKEEIDEILLRHKGKNFYQCAKCGSIKSDAKELARTLYIIEKETADFEEEEDDDDGDELFQELRESYRRLLRDIIMIGVPEECYGNPEYYTKWRNENDKRCLPELNDFDGEVFIESDDVVLKVDDVCGCRMRPLDKER